MALDKKDFVIIGLVLVIAGLAGAFFFSSVLSSAETTGLTKGKIDGNANGFFDGNKFGFIEGYSLGLKDGNALGIIDGNSFGLIEGTKIAVAAMNNSIVNQVMKNGYLQLSVPNNFVSSLQKNGINLKVLNKDQNNSIIVLTPVTETVKK